MKLALFGGTFDPPHAGHLAAARWVRDHVGLDRVELVPALMPPHKPGRPLSSPFHRYAMCVLATMGEPRLGASFRELARGGTSFAIDTLREARLEHPASRIFFVLGTDQFAEIASWRDPRAIVEEFELIVVGRPGTDFEGAVRALPEYVGRALGEGRISPQIMEPVDLSSTGIRERIFAGEPIAGLVSPRVQQYIEMYGLYRPGG
jgi:nicotinate-nucleotide adenylyltransferase